MKLLQLPNPGEGGRLGNNLFAVASTIGLALKHGYTPRFPANWKYRGVFPNIPDEWFGECISGWYCSEKGFGYDPGLDKFIEDGGETISIGGYLQSPKYWQGYGFQIREYLMPANVEPGSLHSVAVHIRRGDYVGNPNYAELPMSYYLNAIESVGLDPVLFSDDHKYLNLNFDYRRDACNEISDFREMIAHSHHIVSNSTFSWWAAYLSGGVVIRPDVYFAGELAKRATTKDFWPDHWWTVETAVKYDLSDVTFVIPVTIEHNDRLENLRTVIAFLDENFNTNILVGEVNTEVVAFAKHFDMPHFHRTKVLNELTRRAKTPYVFNWDADVVCSPYQIYQAVKRLRGGSEVVYPYDGRFFWADRSIIKYWARYKNINCFVGHKFQAVGASAKDPNSYGGAVGYNVEAFWRAGGENENFISYGPEDQERWRRFNLLLNVERVAGGLFHINHWRGVNSCESHPNSRANIAYFKQVQAMNDDQIIEHIKTWAWLKQ